MPGPGRPRLIDKEEVIKVLLKYKSQIVLPCDKIVSYQHEIWKTVSQELRRTKLPKSLHSYVCNNKDFVRYLLNDREVRRGEIHQVHHKDRFASHFRLLFGVNTLQSLLINIMYKH